MVDATWSDGFLTFAL